MAVNPDSGAVVAPEGATATPPTATPTPAAAATPPAGADPAADEDNVVSYLETLIDRVDNLPDRMRARDAENYRPAEPEVPEWLRQAREHEDPVVTRLAEELHAERAERQRLEQAQRDNEAGLIETRLEPVIAQTQQDYGLTPKQIGAITNYLVNETTPAGEPLARVLSFPEAMRRLYPDQQRVARTATPGGTVIERGAGNPQVITGAGAGGPTPKPYVHEPGTTPEQALDKGMIAVFGTR